jgi:3'-phosphoadenosine 5'-phosphosulfate sulfotransferase (PAPS reductase)/FAD synthetase
MNYNTKNLEGHDLYLISISGGKDSTALIDFAIKHFPHNKIQFVHAKIDIDWRETIPTVKAQVEHARKLAKHDFPLHIVEATFADGTPKGFLSKLLAPRIDRITGEAKQNQFPDMQNRWCTSELKLAPIRKLTRELLPNGGSVLNVTGERHAESKQRSKLPYIEANESWSTKAIHVTNFRPILHLSESEVFAISTNNGYQIHPCYSWGVSRASCAICIFSSDEEIKLALKHAPHIVEDYIQAESMINHSFRYKPATKTRPEQKTRIIDILKKA